jgi:RNA polymerase sigma factor (sigma-70 family)
MSKPNIKQLGRDFQKTKSQKIFKQLFDLCKPGVINYYQQYKENTIEAIEDAYNETMISIWNDIDKLDVEKYSISTMIYLKTKQKLIRNNTKSSLTDSYSIDAGYTLNKIYENSMESTISNIEDEYIEDENINTFWNNIKDVIGDSITYDILYDTYANRMSGNDIAEKYNINTQIVANRIFQAKKKIKKNVDIYDEYLD